MSDCWFDCCEDDEVPEEEPNEGLDEVPVNELPVDVPNKLDEIPDDDELDPGRMTVKVPD